MCRGTLGRLVDPVVSRVLRTFDFPYCDNPAGFPAGNGRPLTRFRALQDAPGTYQMAKASPAVRTQIANRTLRSITCLSSGNLKTFQYHGVYKIADSCRSFPLVQPQKSWRAGDAIDLPGYSGGLQARRHPGLLRLVRKSASRSTRKHVKTR